MALTKYSYSSGQDPVTPGAQADDKFIVLIADNPTMVGATILREWNNTGSTYVYDNIATLGEFQVIDLSDHVGTKYIGFYGESTVAHTNGDNYLYLDEVRVRETPTTPILNYSPDNLVFGIHRVNTTTAYQNVTVSNVGSGTLTLTAADVTIIGTDATMFSFVPFAPDFELTVGESGDIQVRYNPTEAGEHTATLRISYAGENYDVALSGTALGENALFESFEDTTFPPVGWAADGGNRSTSYAYDGVASAYRYGSTSGQYVLSTPMLAIENDSRLLFWNRGTSTSGILQVVYSTDRVNWEQLGDNITYASTGTWYARNIDLSTLAGNNYYLGFRTGLASGGHYVDMVIGPNFAALVPDTPTLVSPADEATDVSIRPTFTWTAATTGGMPTSYKIYCDAGPVPNTLIGTSTTTSFTPETALPRSSTLYWTVKAVNDNGESDPAAPRSFTTVPEGVMVIGGGTANNNLPIYPWYNYSYSQTIYLQSDINMANQRIDNIAFYWNGSTGGNNSKDWVVYLAHTDKTAFTGATDWVPYANLTQVFAGALDLPETAGWVNIPLQTPFFYNNTDNLLVCVDENTSGNSGSSAYFYSTAVDDTRALLYYTDGTNPNPATPPDANAQKSAYANIKIQFGTIPTSPVFTYTPDAIDFGQLEYGTASGAMNITVSNTGSGTIALAASDISIIGPDAADFSFGTDNLPANLATGQSVNIPVTVQSTTEGPISATLRMVYNDENYDVALSATVLQEGMVFIGTGTDTNGSTGKPCVYGGYHRNGREQYILTAAELDAAGVQAGYFNTIGFNVMNPNSSADLPNFTIKMAAITESEFTTTSFYDDTTLTQVYTVDFYTPTVGWNQHNLQTPFFWDGTSNLVIQTSYDMLPAWVYHAQTYHTDTTVNRTLHYGSDTTLWQNYATGTRTTKRPNMMLQVIEPIVGAPAAPILLSPEDGTTMLPKAGFNLSWRPDIVTGAMPEYYTVTIATDPNDLFTEYSWETLNTSFNPVIDDDEFGFNFTYGQRYYWTVVAHADQEESDAATPLTFEIETDPAIVALPYAENFDDVTPPAFPRAWTAYKSNATSTIDVRTTQSHTPGNSVYMYARTADETMRLITPPIGVPMNSIKLSFWLRSSGTTNYKMKVGTVNALDETGVFTQVAEIVPTVSGAFVQYQVSFVGYTGTDQYICFEHGVASTYQSFYIDTVLLETLPAVDMKAIGLVGPGSLKVGQESTYNLTVLNFGADAITNYTVNLRDGEDNLLTTTTVTEELAPNATAVVPINWTPTTAGTFSVYAEVVATGDAIESNNASNALNATIFTATTEFLPIGATENLTTVTYAPFDAYWKSFVAETVYLASEIQATGGIIQSLVYYNNFNAEWTFTAQIWMKNTDVANMNTWPTFDGYTLVFSGDLTVPAGINEVVIPITPFTYTGGNLSIRTTKAHQAEWSSNKSWYTTVDTNYPGRTIYLNSDTETDVVYGNPADGDVVNNVPNITFIMDPATLVTTVDAPEAGDAAIIGTNVALTWEAVPYAYSYKVYASEDPYSFSADPTIVYTNGATLPATAAKGFYKVTANTYRGNNRGTSMFDSILQASYTVDENPIEKDKDLLRK
jgi:hypothetical protein